MPDFFAILRMILAVVGLSPSAKVVLAYLWDRQGGNGCSWPSIATIARGCGLARSTVVLALRELEQRGYIARTKPEKPSVRESNSYAVNVSELVRNSDQSEASTSPRIGPEPIRKSDQSKANQSENRTRTSPKIGPELVRNSDPIDSLNDSYNDPKNIYGEFVSLTDAEHAKLVERFGVDGTRERIEALDHYVGSSGRQYRSHYHTILAWEKTDHGTPNNHRRTEPHRDYSRQAEYHGGVVT